MKLKRTLRSKSTPISVTLTTQQNGPHPAVQRHCDQHTLPRDDEARMNLRKHLELLFDTLRVVAKHYGLSQRTVTIRADRAARMLATKKHLFINFGWLTTAKGNREVIIDGKETIWIF